MSDVAYLLSFNAGSFAGAMIASWVLLLLVLFLARKVVTFNFPPWRDLLWQAAVISLVANLAFFLLLPLAYPLAWLAFVAVSYVMMQYWFRIDLVAALVILAIYVVVRFVAGLLLMSP